MSQITIGKIIRRTKKKLRKGYRKFRRNYRLRYTLTLIVGIGLVVFLGLEYSMSNRENEPSDDDSYHRDNTTLARPTDVYGNEIPEHVDVNDKEELEEYIYPESSITSLPTEVETDPKNFHVLVNKDYDVYMYYEPDDLVEPNVNFNFDEEDEKRYLRREAARALEDMFAAADEDGHYLEAVSGYRSYGRQQLLFRNNLRRNGLEYTNLYSAMPGRSEHQTGWAMDITCNSVDNKLSTAFGDTPEGKWVAENCYKFGFIIRYPQGKEDITGYAYEPWHLRYVGYNLARFLYDNDITLDQYYGYILDKDAIHERELAYYNKYMASLQGPSTPEPTLDGNLEDLPVISDEPVDSMEPEGSKEPVTSQEPEKTKKPEKTKRPEKTKEPEVTDEQTPAPESEAPQSTQPQASEPVPTPTQSSTPTPAPTQSPTPTQDVTPAPSENPSESPAPSENPQGPGEGEQTGGDSDTGANEGGQPGGENNGDNSGDNQGTGNQGGTI